MGAIEERARAAGMKKLFVLTTRTAQWFAERGFAPAAAEALDESIEIVTSVLPRNPKKGQALQTTLGNGTVTAVHDGRIGHHSEHGFHFAASTPAEPKLVGVLKSGTTLTIGVPGERIRVPLKGIAKPLAQFEAVCLHKR